MRPYSKPKMDIKNYIRKKLYKSLYHNAYSRSFYTLYGVVAKEILVAFNQFFTWQYPIRSFFRANAIIASALLRLVLGRSTKFSYSFTGEDKIIEGILKPIIYKGGYYVDVGCNHPIFLSNTYGLYRKGWKGICIDANKALIKKYSYYRPKDKSIHALVSNKIEERAFYLAENDGLSTTEDSNLTEIIKLGLDYKTQKHYTKTLTSILSENNFPKNFDILSIDTEEHDFSVLTSLDFEIYRPKLIIVEDEAFVFENCQSNNFYTFLIKNQYNLVGYVLKNAYYLDKSQV
jgi:hypothetical protein